MRWIGFLSIFALSLLPCTAWPQGQPLGPEFRVNTYTTDQQVGPRVSSDAVGNFVVVWVSFGQDGYGGEIFGQRYASSGDPVGPEFRVNTYTASHQGDTRIASDAAGDFVVVWRSQPQDGSGYGIFGQRFASSGAPLGPEFRANTSTTGDQLFPTVASDPAGNFVVAWYSRGGDGSELGVFGQRFASSGVPLGPEFRVNTYTTGSQGWPATAMDSAGNFVVVWDSDGQDGSAFGVFGQRYSSSGSPVGLEFRVNSYTTNNQGSQAVASDSAGNFVVVWDSYAQDGSSDGVFGQRYASSGAPLGPEFRVNSYTTSYQVTNSVASDPSGNFVVAWVSNAQDGSGHGVFAQRFLASGSPSGPEFRVNTFTANFQDVWSVAADAAGNFVVIWESNTQDGSGWGVYGQRFGQIVPVELIRFSVE